ncbi:MAG TPA: cyclic nucleotide-binding domain-containing protein [Candidatus Methylomirabilis sp.]|nr:cyclic nucleotide-binding domain-containing protein [Candidatus Methylomirabilis sp.]
MQTRIETLLIDMLAPNLPSRVLREAEIEELRRGAKLVDVALEYLGLRTITIDGDGEIPLRVVASHSPRDPWREALVHPEGHSPIGILINTADAGPLVLVHEVFDSFADPEKELVRQYAALAVRREPHEAIVTTLRARNLGETEFTKALTAVRRTVRSLDPTVLFSPDGATRVQLGSLSRTTKDILREGLQGDHLFILPASLFEGKTNYADIEFLVYLNFFLRQKTRTRIVGTSRQRQVLHRLLTLTLFGLFDPAAPEPPSFEELAAAYGVGSRETYRFLHTAHELYGTRRDGSPSSPLLGIDDYVDFVVLDGEEIIIPSPSAEVRVAPAGRGFDVRIVQPDGRSSEKQLEVGMPPRLLRRIPPEYRETIQFASDRPRFGVTPLGTSHGFDANGDCTSFIIWLDSKGILVDPSSEALAYLDQVGVAPQDVAYVFLTHIHADHDAGLVEKLLSGSQTRVIASDPVFRTFIEKARLVTGRDFEREGLVTHVSANPNSRVRIEVANEFAQLDTRWNLHPIPTNGFKLTFGGRSFGYSGDTQFDPAMLQDLRRRGLLAETQFKDLMYFFWTPDGQPTVDLLFHEAGIPPIHTDKEMLRALPVAVTSRMSLVHIADGDVPRGFAPHKPRLFATQVILPPTPRSRRRVLLETMHSVAYLYDTPPDTLETLLHGAEVVTHVPDEVIIREGPVAPGEPVHFQIIADGRVSVRDGRRVVTTLGRGDTFGEWGIIHQRGVRAADVVADRSTQTIRLSAEQYHWLVGKHPVIRERISMIRRLLPRLQLAQERARLKAALEPGAKSAIELMTSSQLSGFAIFSRIKTFNQGQHIIVEGDKSDGFYILLSGHLAVGTGGRFISELSEGDVFGELGLLEGGNREASVTVVSADAEVLFMSTQNFQHLVRTMPAFAWETWETPGGRRDLIHRP